MLGVDSLEKFTGLEGAEAKKFYHGFFHSAISRWRNEIAEKIVRDATENLAGFGCWCPKKNGIERQGIRARQTGGMIGRSNYFDVNGWTAGFSELRHERAGNPEHATRGSRGAAGLELMSETDEPKERKAQGTEFQNACEGFTAGAARIGASPLSMKNRLPAPFAERLAGELSKRLRSEVALKTMPEKGSVFSHTPGCGMRCARFILMDLVQLT